MKRTSYTTERPWGVWVGPGPEPGTGRRLYAVQFANREEGKTPLAQAIAFARFLYLTPEGAWKRDQVKAVLQGRLLGCADRAHGLILSHVAEGRPLTVLLDLLPDVVGETRELFA